MDSKEHTQNQFLVGFSGNIEVKYLFDPSGQGDKQPLKNFEFGIGGTSLNLANAIQTLGGKSRALVFTGANEDPETALLNHKMNDYKFEYLSIPILEKGNVAIHPEDGIHKVISRSYKGKIKPRILTSTCKILESEKNQWRIATGVRTKEYKFVKKFLNNEASRGYRGLNPGMQLINRKDIFKDLLLDTDLLVMNLAEYQACNYSSPRGLLFDSKGNRRGPALLIVTNENKPGFFHHVIHGDGQFKACDKYTKRRKRPPYSPGAGDWFSGAFNLHCQMNGKSYEDIERGVLIDGLSFAAQVAGKKVTMPGSINGPSMSDL